MSTTSSELTTAQLKERIAQEVERCAQLTAEQEDAKKARDDAQERQRLRRELENERASTASAQRFTRFFERQAADIDEDRVRAARACGCPIDAPSLFPPTLTHSTHSPALSTLQDGDFMPAEDEPYYSRRARTAALSHHSRSAEIDHATGSLSYGSNVRERSMIWQLAQQHGQSTYPRAHHSRSLTPSMPFISYAADPTTEANPRAKGYLSSYIV